MKEACPYTVRRSKESVDMAKAAPVENIGSCNGHEKGCTESTSTLPAKSTSGTSVVEEAPCQYRPWIMVTRKKRGYNRTNQNSSQGGTTKPAGKSTNPFMFNNMRFEHSKVGPSLHRNDVLGGKTQNETGFNLRRGTLNNFVIGFSPNPMLDSQRKLTATLVGNLVPLPDLAINKKKNPHSVRGKKIIARNILGNSLNSAVSNPFQDLSSKLTSLSASAASSAKHESETSPSVPFKFMASNEEGLGAINDWEGD